MTTGSLEIGGVYKSFDVNKQKVEVLNDINLSIRQGEFVSIVGHSGCGKSTLLNIIAGFVQGDIGIVQLGDSIIRRPGIDRGMVFQDHRLFPWLTIEENISLGVKNVSKKEKEELTDYYLNLVHLGGFGTAYPSQLSGGMSQRAAIARALINKPQVLLLDEPFGALDALTRIQMQQEVLEIWGKEKTTMILVTHDIDEAIYLGDRVVVMSSRPGKIEVEIPVRLPRPRDRNHTDFGRIKKKVYSYLFKDSTVDWAIEFEI